MAPLTEPKASARLTHFLNFSEKSQCGSDQTSDLVTDCLKDYNIEVWLETCRFTVFDLAEFPITKL